MLDSLRCLCCVVMLHAHGICRMHALIPNRIPAAIPAHRVSFYLSAVCFSSSSDEEPSLCHAKYAVAETSMSADSVVSHTKYVRFL